MNLQNFFTDTLNNGGASFNITTGVYNPTQGYFVSLPNYTKKVPLEDFKTSHLKDFIDNNYDVLSNENNFVGGWVDNGIVYLDITEQITDRRRSLELAYNRGQKSVYNANSNVCIDLPTPQKSGTTTQQKAYITITIDNLCK